MTRDSRPLSVEFDHVAVADLMVGAYLLAVEGFAAPDPGVFQVRGDVAVDESCDIVHGLSFPYGERFALVRVV